MALAFGGSRPRVGATEPGQLRFVSLDRWNGSRAHLLAMGLRHRLFLAGSTLVTRSPALGLEIHSYGQPRTNREVQDQWILIWTGESDYVFIATL
jgi:hypothetical protein